MVAEACPKMHLEIRVVAVDSHRMNDDDYDNGMGDEWCSQLAMSNSTLVIDDYSYDANDDDYNDAENASGAENDAGLAYDADAPLLKKMMCYYCCLNYCSSGSPMIRVLSKFLFNF